MLHSEFHLYRGVKIGSMFTVFCFCNAFVCSWFGALVMSVIEMSGLNIEYEWEGVIKIMPLRMRTQSVGRPAAKSLGGGTGRRPREGNDERVDE
ncbi:hypothetical protein Tco_1457528 [Tanacetum coccineum]